MCLLPFGRFITILLLFLFTEFSNIYSQSITPFALNNGGGSVANIEWSIGESVSIAHFFTESFLLNTGMLQPLSSVVTSINENGSEVFGNQIIIGPNPTNNLVHFKGNFTQSGKLYIQVLDAKSSALAIYESGMMINRYEINISMFTYPSGIYYVKVFFKTLNGFNQTGIYKIIKL